ncbi:conserved hypothetical protein [Neisseria gonorrhoeae F62]|nr:conserved hypothetical protein [Neisseria gonorrhoeae F62]
MISLKGCDASLVTDVIDNLFALRLFLIHNRLSPLPEPLPCNSGGITRPVRVFLYRSPVCPGGQPSFRFAVTPLQPSFHTTADGVKKCRPTYPSYLPKSLSAAVLSA